MDEQQELDGKLLMMITDKAYHSGETIFNGSAHIRKKYPKGTSAKALALPVVFALLEMKLTVDEIRAVCNDCIEIATIYKTYKETDE